jgi:hypothetical protein
LWRAVAFAIGVGLSVLSYPVCAEQSLVEPLHGFAAG